MRIARKAPRESSSGCAPDDSVLPGPRRKANMPSSYKYQPLSSPATQIRLLELLPGRGIIQCRLKVANLEEAQGTYEPISYCWKTYRREHWWGGSYMEKKKQKESRVLVDGLDLLITQSLQTALRHMRLETQVRVLWADAICINQGDNEEKSAQVSMMGKIYKSGSRTIIWLGDADFWTRTAFKHMRRARPTPGRLGRADRSQDSNSTGHSTGGDQHQLESANEGGMARLSRYRQQVTALCRDTFIFFVYRSIANRPYFSRAWIVQEVVLSDSIVVLCGKHGATGNNLYNWLCDDEWLSGTASGLIRYSIIDLWDNLQVYDLDCIISKLSHMKTSDPRDKLYSALSLDQDYIDSGSITVDYRKTVDEVFLDTTKVLLSRSPFLDLLSISYGTARPDGKKHAPSWVWNPESRSTEFHLSWTISHASRPFRATRGSHSQAQFQDQKLGLRGYIFDNVRKVGNVLSASSSALWSHDETREAIRCYCSWINVCGLNEQGITDTEATAHMQTFRRTLKPLVEKFTPAEEWPEYDEYEAAYFLLFHKEVMKRFGRFFIPETQKATMRSRLGLWATVEAFRLLPLFEPECLVFFHDWHTKAMVGHCVVWTDNGRYALCPGGTMPGDRLCLLQGANVPILLRPSGENWTLVGECYTEGAMYGELWDPERCEPLWIE
ncbi:hypothetical protein KVR01_009288 [Diaporthe batatas]|uniref:uncharacterized protein n=1 Tax=Diaporthe batatas TaxID=748121 RepID=UPI001D05A4FD|nr:uncharacterized protein KVR01_009288 [Diaporthe batatas]KAG8161024.1 hypothetical protein KVR01_009288 [Diaporthe batatas]